MNPLASSPESSAVDSSALDADPPPEPPIGPLQLFITFSHIALSGFGGVMPFFYLAMVEKYQWLSNAEAAELIAFGQVLPGPTICNVAVIVGYRKAGFAGSMAALAGMITFPMIIIILVGMAYTRYGEIRQVQQALAGMSAVAAGLVFSTGLKMTLALQRRWLYGLFLLLEFTGIGLLHWPLPVMVLGLAPLSVWLALREYDARKATSHV